MLHYKGYYVVSNLTTLSIYSLLFVTSPYIASIGQNQSTP